MFSRILLMVFMVSLLSVNISVAEEDDFIIAKAGDYVIKKSDLDRLISYYPADKQKFLLENPQQKITLLKRILQVKVISDIARKEGFDKKAKIQDQLDFLINDLISRLYLSEVIIKDATTTEDDLKQYYKLNKNKFAVPEQVKARHILIKVSSEASEEEKNKAKQKTEEILKSLKNGEDFAKLAEEYSEDPGSSSKKGGDIGYFAKGRMVKPFEDAAFSLKPGETSGIIETKFGYHIIKVEDYKEAHTKTFDEARDVIEKQLKDEFGRSKAEEFIQKATEKAGMEIYSDKILGKETKKK